MHAPEPLDESGPEPVEVRGGDRPEDYIPPFATGGLIPAPPSLCSCCEVSDEDEDAG